MVADISCNGAKVVENMGDKAIFTCTDVSSIALFTLLSNENISAIAYKYILKLFPSYPLFKTCPPIFYHFSILCIPLLKKSNKHNIVVKKRGHDEKDYNR